MAKYELTNYEPLAYPIKFDPQVFTCQACSKRVTREHINVWEWRSYDHIRARYRRTAQLCDECRPTHP